ILSFVLTAVVAGEVLIQTPPAIIKQSHDLSSDGSYSYSYQTENGIYQAENGTPVVVDPSNPPVVVSQGQYQYTAPDGTPIAVSYVADHNGFQPQGEHIPAVSPLIQRALEYIRAHPPQPETHHF
ncbi:Endocuticle structural glycoprotein SgAbd-1, partial [Dufourea novaeangliae]